MSDAERFIMDVVELLVSCDRSDLAERALMFGMIGKRLEDLIDRRVERLLQAMGEVHGE